MTTIDPAVEAARAVEVERAWRRRAVLGRAGLAGGTSGAGWPGVHVVPAGIVASTGRGRQV